MAALEVKTGKVIGEMFSRKRHQEVIEFFEEIRRNYPSTKLYILLDNFSAHKHKKVKKWIEQDGKLELIFLPTNSAWLNYIEPFFQNLKKFAISGSNYQTKQELDEGILSYIKYHNQKWEKDSLKKVA